MHGRSCLNRFFPPTPAPPRLPPPLLFSSYVFFSVSPVFFSTRADGTSIAGLSELPDNDRSRPIVFVGNHQLFGLDLGVIVER